MANIALCLRNAGLSSDITGWLNESFAGSVVIPFVDLEELIEAQPKLTQLQVQSNQSGTPVKSTTPQTQLPIDPKEKALMSLDMMIIEWQATSKFDLLKITKEKFISERDGKKRHPKVILISVAEAGDPNIKRDLTHADDWLIIPLDKLTFLQKVDAWLAKSPNFNPRFLFRCAVNYPIEIARAMAISEIGELGIVIPSTSHLNPGAIGHLHLDWNWPNLSLPLQSTKGKKPTDKKINELRFRYFGIDAATYKEVRLFLKNAKSSAKPVKINTPPPSVTIAANAEKCRIAVITMNADNSKSISDLLESRLLPVEVVVFRSFVHFISSFEKLKAAVSKTPSIESAPQSVSGDLNLTQGLLRQVGTVVCCEVSGDFHFLKFAAHAEGTEPRPDDGILGHPSKFWIENPQILPGSVYPDDKAEWQEFCKSLFSGGKPRGFIRFIDRQQRPINTEVSGDLTLKTNLIETNRARINIRALTDKDWAEKTTANVQTNISPFDMIILDIASIEDPTQIGEKLAADAFKVQTSKGTLSPRVLFLGNVQSAVPLGRSIRSLAGYLAQPVDKRLLVQLVWEILYERPHARQHVKFKDAEFDVVNLQIDRIGYLGVSGQLLEISEFGMVVRFLRTYDVGTCVKLYVNLPNLSLSVFAKCIGQTPDAEIKGQWKLYFLFWSVRDETLQKIRNWIRLDYAKKKEADGENAND